MAKYSNQLIVQAHADATISLGSRNLNKKAAGKGLAAELVDFPISGQPGYAAKRYALTTALSKLDKDSRLYIRGHGSWKNQTVGGVNAKTWAQTLVDGGLRRVKIVSVCACQAGRDRDSADAFRVKESADSFASQFHKFLKELGGIEVDLYARVYNVIVRSGHGGIPVGQKYTTPKGKPAAVHGREHSKILWRWVNGRQERQWISYDGGDYQNVEEALAIDELMAMEI